MNRLQKLAFSTLDDRKCPICLIDMDPNTDNTELLPTGNPCGHFFHLSCLRNLERCALCRAHLKEQAESESEPATSPQPTLRILTAFNMFIREKLNTPEIRGLNNKDKMIQIAQRWSSLTEDEKQHYQQLLESFHNRHY